MKEICPNLHSSISNSSIVQWAKWIYSYFRFQRGSISDRWCNWFRKMACIVLQTYFLLATLVWDKYRHVVFFSLINAALDGSPYPRWKVGCSSQILFNIGNSKGGLDQCSHLQADGAPWDQFSSNISKHPFKSRSYGSLNGSHTREDTHQPTLPYPILI